MQVFFDGRLTVRLPGLHFDKLGESLIVFVLGSLQIHYRGLLEVRLTVNFLVQKLFLRLVFFLLQVQINLHNTILFYLALHNFSQDSLFDIGSRERNLALALSVSSS